MSWPDFKLPQQTNIQLNSQDQLGLSYSKSMARGILIITIQFGYQSSYCFPMATSLKYLGQVEFMLIYTASLLIESLFSTEIDKFNVEQASFFTEY